MAEKTRFLKGQLLLDSGQLQGSFFQRSVVLICQHDAEGAFGLVLTQPLGRQLAEVAIDDLPEAARELPVYAGGPVQPSAITYLHSNLLLINANVMPRLEMGHALEDLVALASMPSPEQKLKVFAGYAGWSPGQLEDEIKRKAWLACPASLPMIFDAPPEELWRSILKQKGGLYSLLADSPEDLSWN